MNSEGVIMQRCLSASTPCSTESGLLTDSPNNYHQRNMLPSHTYRVGFKIFGKTPAYRTRFIDTSLCRQRLHLVSHPIMSKRLQDLKVGKVTTPTDTPLQETIRKTEKKSPSTFTTTEYRNWIADRRQLRTDLEKGISESWLSNKDCTPIEATLLAKLQTERRLAGRKVVPPTPVESSDSDDDELSPLEVKRLQYLEKKALLHRVKKLQDFLIQGRVRLVGLLLPHSVADYNFLVTNDVLFGAIVQLRPPVEQDIVDIACAGLEYETNVTGRVCYQLLFKADLVELVEKYWSGVTASESEALAIDQDNGDRSSVGEETCSTVTSSIPAAMHMHQSTMTEGENGKWSEEFKLEALRQFNELMKYCTEHGIELNRNLAERALLYPADNSRRECLSHLREPGHSLPLQKTFNPPLQLEDSFSLSALQKVYGWQHKIMQGPQPLRMVRLPTGQRKRIKPKVDCWLTFAEFKNLTEELRNRPGFNYKYHGLPSNSAFWPGALRDKLRLYLPQETLETRPYSLYNIFQPVHRPKVYNPFTPQPITDGVWPENDRGYVQLGSSLARTKKTYCPL